MVEKCDKSSLEGDYHVSKPSRQIVYFLVFSFSDKKENAILYLRSEFVKHSIYKASKH